MQNVIICTLLLSFIYYVSCQVTCTQQHVIVEGDTCFAIASANNIDVQFLMKINPDVDCSNLQIGDQICIQGSVPTVTCTMSHTIVSGDTCFDIASANGLDVDTLKQLNSGIDCSNLQVGAVICVAGSAMSATPVQSTQAPTAPPAPTVASPSVGTPVSVAPSSVAPTSAAPTSPSSVAPSSTAPSTTAPTTEAPSVQPTTASPSTSAPSSAAPTGTTPSSRSPSSAAPSSTSPTSTTPEPTVRTPNSSKPSDISGNNNARASDASQTQFLLTLFVVCLAMIL